MSPKVSEEHLAARRQQILDAAVECFSRIGFYRATIEDIRLESGLSRGAVYHYFKSKEDIIDALRRRSGEQDSIILESSSEGANGLESLINLVDVTGKRIVSDESTDANRLATFLWAEALVNDRILRGQIEAVNPYRDTFGQAIRQAQKEGKISSDIDADAAALVITGALAGIQIQLAWQPDIDGDAALEALEAILTGGFLA